MIRFIAIVLTAFFDRVNPVSTIANPSCMNITRKPAISSHARLSELSSGGDDAAVCAHASNGNDNSASAATVAANPSCDRLGIISTDLDMTGTVAALALLSFPLLACAQTAASSPPL